MKRAYKIATDYLVKKGSIIRLMPKSVIMRALGGYQSNALPQATKVDEQLAQFCIKNQMIIVPGNTKTLRFVSMDDIPALAKELAGPKPDQQS